MLLHGANPQTPAHSGFLARELEGLPMWTLPPDLECARVFDAFPGTQLQIPEMHLACEKLADLVNTKVPAFSGLIRTQSAVNAKAEKLYAPKPKNNHEPP